MDFYTFLWTQSLNQYLYYINGDFLIWDIMYSFNEAYFPQHVHTNKFIYLCVYIIII